MNTTLKLFFVLLFCCDFGLLQAETEYLKTDKIRLYFGEKNNQGDFVVEDSNYFKIFIYTDIDGVSKIELSDVSARTLKCTNDIIPSPSRLASFDINPSVNLKQVELNVRLPCAVYHGKWDVVVKIRSTNGNFYIKKRLPVRISNESPGYYPEGHEYSGALPINKK